MPVLNRADTVEKAIRSVLDQQYENLEFIILDGGSSDDTVEIIKRYEQHLAFWQSEPDDGAVFATNAGIKKATGDLIAIFMADDWYELETFKKIASAYQANPDADMITCGGRIVTYDERLQTYKSLWTYTRERTLALNFYNICFAVSAICCRFIKRSFYQRIGLYTTSDFYGKHYLTNDKEFLLRAVLHQVKNVFVDHLGHTYLAHKESSSFANNQANALRYCEEHMQIAETYLKKDLSLKYKLLLIYWYNEQSTRVILYKLLNHHAAPALKTAQEGFKKYHIVWLITFCSTTCKIVMKKSLRYLRKLYATS